MVVRAELANAILEVMHRKASFAQMKEWMKRKKWKKSCTGQELGTFWKIGILSLWALLSAIFKRCICTVKKYQMKELLWIACHLYRKNGPKHHKISESDQHFWGGCVVQWAAQASVKFWYQFFGFVSACVIDWVVRLNPVGVRTFRVICIAWIRVAMFFGRLSHFQSSKCQNWNCRHQNVDTWICLT
jgi:hypothetical protein